MFYLMKNTESIMTTIKKYFDYIKLYVMRCNTFFVGNRSTSVTYEQKQFLFDCYQQL